MTRRSRHPLVTVVVPAWNAERTLSETLASVAAQTYRNLEIIIVDDGSTDSTASVAAEFCARHPSARLVRQQNGGVARARNRGIEEARGEWVAPIDADDLWHPTKIEKQLAAASAASETPGFVYCWYQSIDDEGFVLGSGPRLSMRGRAFNQLAYMNPVYNGSALLILRSVALSVGGYDPSLRDRGSEGCEDVMIQLRIARDHPVEVVPEHLVGYRKHASGMSRNNHQIIRSWRLVYQTLIAEESHFPRPILRWNEGFFRMALAEDYAFSGHPVSAVPQLGGALWHDPLRWTVYCLYRLTRTAARLARGRRPLPPKRHFSEVEPASFVPPDPDELKAFAALLRSIDARRLQRLAVDEGAFTARAGVPDRVAGSPPG